MVVYSKVVNHWRLNGCVIAATAKLALVAEVGFPGEPVFQSLKQGRDDNISVFFS